MPGEKAEKREEKANYSSKNIDLLGLAAAIRTFLEVTALAHQILILLIP